MKMLNLNVVSNVCIYGSPSVVVTKTQVRVIQY